MRERKSVRSPLALGLLGIAVLSSAGGGQNASAQTPTPTTISREDSLLRADVPGLTGAKREAYRVAPVSNYWGNAYLLGQVAVSGNYPRTEAQLMKGNYPDNYVESKKIDIDLIKRNYSFLREKQINESPELKLQDSDARHFFAFSSETASCFAFNIIPDSYQQRYTNGYLGGNVGVTGYYCGPPGVPLTANDVQWVLWGYQVRQQSGASIRLAAAPGTPVSERLAQNAPPLNAPRANPPAPPNPPQGPPPTLRPAQFTPPPIGTRFVSSEPGYLQVTAVAGNNVVTVNAGNRSATWFRGLLFLRSPSSILEQDKAAALWPIQVGKTATFDERIGSDGWKHMARVLRTENYSLGGSNIPVFVIEVRQQSINPTQGGLDLTRTYWYSPENGFSLRMRTVQGGGPPAQLTQWDITQIAR